MIQEGWYLAIQQSRGGHGLRSCWRQGMSSRPPEVLTERMHKWGRPKDPKPKRVMTLQDDLARVDALIAKVRERHGL